jgi:hypothetical protein
MKDTLLTAGAGEVAVMVTGVTAQALPTPDDVSTIGQLIIQSIIAIITVIKIWKDRRKNK